MNFVISPAPCQSRALRLDRIVGVHSQKQGERWVAAVHGCHVIAGMGLVTVHRRRLHLFEQVFGVFKMAYQQTAHEWRQIAQDG